MNDYIPTKVRDLTESKQRVMRNVMNEIENKSRTPKHKWQYVVITAVLTMSAMLFVFNEVVIENDLPATEVQSPSELHLNLNKPTFTEEQGSLYLHGITLGDSQKTVIERFGENYSILQEDGSGADMILNYEDHVKFYFNEDQLDSVVFMSVDESYVNRLFNDYDGFKFFLSMPTAYDGRFAYSNETNQVLNASTATTDGKIQLSLNASDRDLSEIAEYLYVTKQNIGEQHLFPTNSNIDLAKPSFSEEKGRLYFHGVTLGDSPLTVIERLGSNYLIGKVDSGEETDFTIDYDGKASFTFFSDKLDSILLTNVDKNYFDQIYEDYDGFKFISSPYDKDSDRIVYSKESKQALKATTNVPNGDLYLYLSYPDPTFYEQPEMQNLD